MQIDNFTMPGYRARPDSTFTISGKNIPTYRILTFKDTTRKAYSFMQFHVKNTKREVINNFKNKVYKPIW
jgi:hypothetical protein